MSVLAHELSIRYGPREVVRGVNFTVRSGEVLALVGPSGSGKSSVLLALAGLLDLVPGASARGRLEVAGHRLHEPGLDRSALRRTVGLIFQQPTPFPLSVRENVHLALREHGVRSRSERDAITERVLREVGLRDELTGSLEQRADRLSGGQQQRLCLARALALEPAVLLLDEPCSALDPMSAARVEDCLRALRPRTTQVIVTHNLAQARRLADRVAVLWTQEGIGRTIEEGTADEVFLRPRHPRTVAYLAGIEG